LEDRFEANTQDSSEKIEGLLVYPFFYFSHLYFVVILSQIFIAIVVGIRYAQISLMLKLRKDRRTKILLLLKLGIKVCRIITERYRHLILYKRR
jgi:hypothetical protein